MPRTRPLVDDLPDEALLAGFAAGDPALAGAFVDKFAPRVYGVAARILRDPSGAEDVAQAAFERAWRHAGTYDPRRGSVAGWLVVITRNLAIDAVRVRRPVPLDGDALVRAVTGEAHEHASPEQCAIDREAAARLRAALRVLPPEQARAVVLAGIGGLSASQVAGSEGIPLGTAKTRIRTAMRKLRGALRDEEPGGA